MQIKILFGRNAIKKICKTTSEIKAISYISLIWIVVVIALFVNNKYFDPPTDPLQLNAWGDYLAGFFAPLLFIWLVYGVFLQKKEFSNALKSFSSQYDEMKAQNEQIVIQQINTWFDRNLKNIQIIKTSIFQTSHSEFNSIAEVAIELEKDIAGKDKYIDNDSKYFKIYDDLKNIFETIIYIEENLNTQANKYKDKGRILESINEINKEFSVLFKSELLDLKKILLVAYFLIALHGRAGYEKYTSYLGWIGDGYNTEDIYNEIISMNLSDIDKILIEVLNNFQTINIDFETWKIRK